MTIALSRSFQREGVPARLRPRGLWRAKKGRVRAVARTWFAEMSKQN
jgi:hypothetical protein